MTAILLEDYCGYAAGTRLRPFDGFDYGMRDDHEALGGEPYSNWSAGPEDLPFVCAPDRIVKKDAP